MIVKALECCSEANNCSQCKYEPTEYQKGTIGCANELMKDAINLINSQNEEIERLALIIDEIEYDYHRLTQEASIIQSEAIKEFVNKILNPFKNQKYLDKRDLEIIVETLAKYY